MGRGGDAKESRRRPFPTAPPSGEEHTKKQPTDDDGRKERVPGKYGTRSQGVQENAGWDFFGSGKWER